MPYYDTLDAAEAVDEHVHAFFQGHKIESRTWDAGPIRLRVPDFRVHVIAPGPRCGYWTYVTNGVWSAVHRDEHGIEFVLATDEYTPRAVELLAINAFYHAGLEDQRLDLGHTATIGEPWLPGSACDHSLISQPYPWGPELEACDWNGGHARLLWVLPITRAERDFKRDHGLEALEKRMEDAAIWFADPQRASVV